MSCDAPPACPGAAPRCVSGAPSVRDDRGMSRCPGVSGMLRGMSRCPGVPGMLRGMPRRPECPGMLPGMSRVPPVPEVAGGRAPPPPFPAAAAHSLPQVRHCGCRSTSPLLPWYAAKKTLISHRLNYWSLVWTLSGAGQFLHFTNTKAAGRETRAVLNLLRCAESAARESPPWAPSGNVLLWIPRICKNRG